MNEIGGVPLIKVSTRDTNADGKNDVIDLHLEVKSLPGRGFPITRSIRNVKVFGTVDFSLEKMVQLEMISMFQLNIDTPSGASSISAHGELEFVQSSPIHMTSVKRTLYNSNPLIDNYSKYSMNELLEFYSFRKGRL